MQNNLNIIRNVLVQFVLHRKGVVHYHLVVRPAHVDRHMTRREQEGDRAHRQLGLWRRDDFMINRSDKFNKNWPAKETVTQRVRDTVSIPPLPIG